MTETAKLTASDGAVFDKFGFSVGISGGTVVVGAHAHDATAPLSGSASMCQRPPGGWERRDVPRPWARGAGAQGAPRKVPTADDERVLEARRRELQRVLIALSERASQMLLPQDLTRDEMAS